MTPVEAVQAGLVWRVARQKHYLKDSDPFVVVSSVTSSGMSTTAATVAEPPLKRARCSTILDQVYHCHGRRQMPFGTISS
eukprot:6066370-Amphidinium_carterae.1